MQTMTIDEYNKQLKILIAKIPHGDGSGEDAFAMRNLYRFVLDAYNNGVITKDQAADSIDHGTFNAEEEPFRKIANLAGGFGVSDPSINSGKVDIEQDWKELVSNIQQALKEEQK